MPFGIRGFTDSYKRLISLFRIYNLGLMKKVFSGTSTSPMDPRQLDNWEAYEASQRIPIYVLKMSNGPNAGCLLCHRH